MGYQILIAEDDKDIVELLKLYLENEGFVIFSANDGEEALKVFNQNRIDMAVVDIMMPKMNGFVLVKEIRKSSKIPILILSARSEDESKILGLNIGADDYLTKPFNPLEIIARVKSALRRFYDYDLANEDKQSMTDSCLKNGNLILNTTNCSIENDGEILQLTPTEYRIMEMFMKSPGRVFTKMQIYEYVSGEAYLSDDRTLMVHISNLREKIEKDSKNPQYIKTVRGLGYKIEKYSDTSGKVE